MADIIERDNYTEIICDPGETYSKSLSDGESWENNLIDITADGACYSIYTGGSDWTIRNLGIRGQIDAEGAPDSGPFTSDGLDAGVTGYLENVYLPGSTYGRNEVGTNNPIGFYLSPGHAGELIIRNYHAKDMPSHGMYCSDPGHPSGGSGGTVKVYDSYVHDLDNSGFRLGSTGSFIDNCCAARTTRGIWCYFEDIETYDSHLVDNSDDIVVGSGSYSKSATCTVNNTYFDTYREPNGTLYGSSAGSPTEYVPDGVPTTPEEAASGGGSGGFDWSDVDPLEAETFDHNDLPGHYEGQLDHFGIGSN